MIFIPKPDESLIFFLLLTPRGAVQSPSRLALRFVQERRASTPRKRPSIGGTEKTKTLDLGGRAAP